MSLATRAFLWILVTGAAVLLSHATFQLKCPQGQFLNRTSTGRQVCEKCPNNTYWVMRLSEEAEVIGVACESCPLWQTSPAGSLDFSFCQCDNENCNTSTKDSSMGMIIGIIIAIIVLGAVIAALFWCKTYGPELVRALSGRDAAEAEIAADRDDGYTRMLPGDSPNLLDCDIAIEITDEQLDDTGYNNETAQGDHNDFEAVLRAAVISEKRRSRIVSMSSVTELDRYRAGSMSSMSGRAFAHPAGYGPLQNQQSPSHHPGQQAPPQPQPKYADYAHLSKAQTVL